MQVHANANLTVELAAFKRAVHCTHVIAFCGG